MLSVPINPKRFIALGLVLIVPIMSIYFLVIDQWLLSPHPSVPGSYKELLLTQTRGQKILIDSGSNSYHGVDTIMLGKHFNMPAINMADNAGNPIAHKFRYLVQHANAGDIILLPLEWPQYTRTTYQETYVEPLLMGKINYYYHALPYPERIKLMYTSVRLSLFFSAFSKRQSNPHNSKWARKHLSEYAQRLGKQNDFSFGSAMRDASGATVADNAPPGSCDNYVLSTQRRYGFRPGKDFKEALKILKAAQKKGVHIVFTPPTVVDRAGSKPCYSTTKLMKPFNTFQHEVKSLIEKQGFLYLGTPEQNHFTQQYYRDTFYHLTEAGAKIRTRRLIEQMQQAGLQAADRNYHPKQTLRELGSLVDELNARISAGGN